MNDEKVRSSLKKIIHGNVIWDKDVLNYYSVDASFYQIIPKVVVIPKSEMDVITAVKFANKNKISITVRGAGTGLVGNALNDGIIIDLKNLNSIKIGKNYAKIGPGILKGQLDEVLGKEGKFFPPNPSIGGYCSLGGMIGNNASGSRTLKYGSTIDNLIEVTFVDGTGKKITLPKERKLGKKILNISKKIDLKKFPKVSKNSCGYLLNSVNSTKDTHKVFAGSEGTLGIILSAKLKIVNLPKKRILFVIEYQSVYDAADNCQIIRTTSPSAIEFVDKPTLKQFKSKFSLKTECLLFVEYDGKFDEKYTKLFFGKIAKILQDKNEIEKWWKFRDSALSYSLKSIKKEYRIPHIIEDATVPIEKLQKLFKIIKKINTEFRTKTIMYGHAGNGNIHVRIISNRNKIENLEKITKWYFSEIKKIEGTITGEHGDGIPRTEFVKFQYGGKNYTAFIELKKLFDPKGILNPGKITHPRSHLKRIECL